jgi:hypothetical protein
MAPTTWRATSGSGSPTGTMRTIIRMPLAVILEDRTPVSCAFVAAGRGTTSRGICARRPGAATGRLSPAAASVSVVPRVSMKTEKTKASLRAIERARSCNHRFVAKQDATPLPRPPTALRRDFLSGFTHHWDNRRRVRHLDTTECLKSVPLVQRNVSYACRF